MGWGKHSAVAILPRSLEGVSKDMRGWLSFDSLASNATKVLHDSVSEKITGYAARIDARPEKGMVKFVFEDHFIEIQLDATKGQVLNIGRRWWDLIENMHDGSLIDHRLGFESEHFKLTYTTLMGLTLLTLSFTGFFLWRGSGIKRARQ